MNRLSKEYTTTNNKEKVKAQYTYGKTGGVTLVTNDTSAIANKYDNKGLVMEQKLFEDGKSYAMVYGNNANGKCVYSKIYNNNTGQYGDYDIQQMINYEYDAKGNMTTVSDSLNNSKVMARYTYDSNDNLSSVTYGNGTSTSYTYNKGNMIEKVINNNADNTQMSIYSYDYYLDGNVSQQNRNGVKCYYDYDEFSRIIDEDYGREEIDYYYDVAGNRTLKKICDDNGDTDVNYTYDLNNRLLEESTDYYSKNEIDVTKYVYDNNGNQIKKIGYITKGVNGSPSQDLVSENELNNTYEIYKYNEFNEMTSFESNKESKWEYAYLPNGLRYRKSNASNFDRYVWDRNGNIIAEMNGEGNLTNKYVRGNKLISKNGNEYFGYDGHGSVVNISNESGKSIKSYDYDAFGVELNRDVNDTNLFRYCGEQYDNETDSIYLRARYYSPSLGRFTTEDPAKDGDNWYSYCAGNPVTRIDSNGQDWDWLKNKLKEGWNNLKDAYNAESKIEQRILWKLGAEMYLKSMKGYNTSAWLLEHSLQDNPSVVYRGEGSHIAELIKKDDVFKSSLSLKLDNMDQDNYSGKLDGVVFEKGDLYYAIHNADVYIDAKRGKNGDWSVNVKVSDTYDYTELLLPDAYGKNLQHNLGAVANDAAYVSSKIGAIKPYKIYVNFKTTYNGKKKEVKKDAKK